MRQFYKMKEEYRLQSWYTEDPHELIYVYTDRKMLNFGVDCRWQNFYTKQYTNNWNSVFRKIPDLEAIEIIRRHNLEQLLNETSLEM